MADEFIEYDFDCVEMDTYEAFLFHEDDEGKEKRWIPKSVIEEADRNELQYELDMAGGGRTEPGTVQVELWFAEKEGMV